MPSLNYPAATAADRPHGAVQCILDKASIVFSIPNPKTSFGEAQWDRLRRGLDQYLTRYMGGTARYAYHFEIYGTMTCQVGYRGQGESFRIEFNPCDVDLGAFHMLRKCLPESAWRFPRVTRLDVAVDYRRDLATHCVFGSGFAKGSAFWGPTGVETTYLGGRQSARQFRFYNKALEQGDPTQHWWRCEAQWRVGGRLWGDFSPMLEGVFAGVLLAEWPTEGPWRAADPRLGIAGVKAVLDRDRWRRHWLPFVKQAQHIEQPEHVWLREGPGLWLAFQQQLRGQLC